MTKTEAKYISIIGRKLDECFEALDDLEVGTAAEKEMRKTIENYQNILAKVKPGTPNVPKSIQGGQPGGFTSII